MEENKEEYRLCAHCKKDVASANFVLHESHCRRFLSLCPDCGEPVPRDEMEQHRSEQHTQVRCTQCKQKLERCHLQDHQENECEGRLQCCQFCQLQLPFRKLAEHISACGSRTELCPDCDRYIRLQDMDAHSTSCSSRPQEGAPSKGTSQNAAESQFQQCLKCMKSVSVAQMQEHQLECLAASPPSDTEDAVDPDIYQATSFSLQGRKTSKEKDMGEISTCPQCHLALPWITLKWHESKCRLFGHLRKSDAN
ncbi:XIAP-associated factor 1 [Brienomyrus brachyistius]|uniref:XIAP-associated factor 1 n=1 Tax=Brienomyrus brachyistius TaxID=42636 RepID=UPI0020B1CDAF|nr:XIAP-associated factor 1 [Brienomyrus brachyistius]